MPPAISTRALVCAKQLEWARARQLPATDAGYLPTVSDNLFRPLSEAALAGFERGSGSELLDRPGRPAKLRALHSSAALAVNFFDPLVESPERILRALGCTPSLGSVSFESQFPTGLGGNPPNLDLCVRLPSGHIVGVESKFTEWLTPKPDARELFKPKYFLGGRKAWGSLGLERSQSLAESLSAKTIAYRHLDAAQLLKHVLGLASSGRPFELVYAYYDVDCPEAGVHRDEVRHFSDSVRGDFEFRCTTYQEVFGRMRRDDLDTRHLGYLGTRYSLGEEVTR